jgi:peptidoglycan/xylan/chitin deacetylase (PgdA/CDA1 family)
MWHAEGREIPSHWFVVTFDDVYENVYANAWPILRQLNIPATLFLATAYLDSDRPFPFDDWTHSGSPQAATIDWKPMTTRQCLQMQDSGLIELGAHTHTHEDFRGRPQDLHEDLLVCKAELRKRFGQACPTFAFPYGTRSLGFSGPTLAAAARQAGLACSLTTEDEQVFPDSDPFDWGRFTVEQFDSANTLAAKLEGSFTNLKSAWGKVARAAVLA